MTSRTPSGFRLQFDPAEIPALAERYGPSQDDKALAAGRLICDGAATRPNLEIIFRWKTGGRGISRLARNTDDEIADALSLSVCAKTERAAVAVLVGLEGVAVPVASAILTTIDPERYSVIDFRALEALGSQSANRTVDFYLEYLKECRDLAKAHRVSLRNLDRALWQWSSEHAKQ
jgi:hypothetical protein